MGSSPNGKRPAFAVLRTVLTLVFIGLGVFYLWTQRAEFEQVKWPSVIAVLTVAGGYVASVLFRSLYNVFSARHLGAPLSIPESFALSAVVTASNSVLPVNAGAAFRAYYMNKVHAFPLAYFASVTAVSFVVTGLLMSLIAMILLVVIFLQLGYFRLDLFIVLPMITGVASVGLLLRSKKSQSERKDGESMWESFRSGYLRLVEDKRLVYLSLLIVTLNFIVASFVWTVALRESAPEIATTEALLLAASQIVSGLITLTPGATGFQELVGLYVGTSFHVSTVQLFAVLIWVRLVRVIASVALAVPCAIALHQTSNPADA